MNTDRIEKTTVLRVPRSRVWQALSNSKEFGRWFGMELDGEFKPHERLKGKITTPGYEHLQADIAVERVEPEWLLAWRWHPGATEPSKDYSKEPTTLVSFVLSDVTGGTKLTITETGFENLPVTRRENAYRENESGWSGQIAAITRHLAEAA